MNTLLPISIIIVLTQLVTIATLFVAKNTLHFSFRGYDSNTAR